MQLFYAPGLSADQQCYTFGEEESRHCVRVLRLREGDRLYLTDGEGAMCLAEIGAVSPRACTVRILERREHFEQRGYRLHMAVAPTKNADRFEWFVEKATEIGIDRITPLLTERCERRSLKRERLEKVATAAVKQSLKAYHPRIDEPLPFAQIVGMPFAGKKLIAHCGRTEAKVPLREAVAAGEDALVLIGPEGDFSEQEIAAALSHGFREISLGRSRLRTETAALAAVHSLAFINE